MKFKTNIKPVTTSEFWYDLMDGGYICPEDLLENEDAEKVRNAMQILQEFFDQSIDEGHVELI
jgi:hypothetical protein